MQQESDTSLRLKDHPGHHRSTPPLSYQNPHHNSFPNQHVQPPHHHNSHSSSSIRSAHGSSSSLSSLGGSGAGLLLPGRGPSPALQDNLVVRSTSPHLACAAGAQATQSSPTDGQGSSGSSRPAARWVPPSQAQQKAESHNNAIFRRARGVLNKLTPDKFDKLTSELLAMIGRDSVDILKGVIILIFEKALDEPKYSSMYAQLCRKINKHLNSDTFCVLLLRKAQSEFENRQQASESYEGRDLTQEEEESRNIAKQKMIGNIKFICELGKEELLNQGILHECVQHLLKRKPTRELSEDLECLCQIMKTIGAQLDTAKSVNLTEQYFKQMSKYEKDERLPQRIRFLIRDVIELRANKWTPVRRVQRENGPVSIQQIRSEAYREMGIPNPNNPNVAILAAMQREHQQALLNMGIAGVVNPFVPGLLPFPSMGGGSLLGPNQGLTINPFLQNSNQSQNLPPSRNQSSSNGTRISDSIGNRSGEVGGGIGMAATYCNNNTSSHAKRNVSPSSQQLSSRNVNPSPNSPNNNPPNNNNVSQHNNSYYDQPTNRSYRDQQPSRDFSESRFDRPGGVSQGGYQSKQFNANNNSAGNRTNIPNRSNLPPRMLRKIQQDEANAAAQQGLIQQGGHYDPAHPSHYSSPYHTQSSPGSQDRLANSYQVASMGGPKNMNPLFNFSTANNALYGNGGEISLRPPENSIVSLSNVHQPGRNDLTNPFPSSRSSPLAERRAKAGLGDPTASSLTSLNKEAAQPQPQPKKLSEKESFLSSFTSQLGDHLTSQDDCDSLVEKVNGLSFNDKYREDALLVLLKKFLDQDQLAPLLIRLNFSNETLKKAYKSLLNELQALEATVPRAKSHLASLLGQLVEGNHLCLSDTAEPLSGGRHYPLFLLTLQQLHKSKGEDWLYALFTSSQINVMSMVPECDRRKDRVADILEDRGLTYLEPLYRIETVLMRQFQLLPTDSKTSKEVTAHSGGGGNLPKDGGGDPATAQPTCATEGGPPAAGPLWRWVKDNVSSPVQKSWGFIDILTTCLLKYSNQAASKGTSASETTIFAKYDKVLLALVHDSVHLQLALLYALQTHVHNIGFPKGLIFKYFVWLYDNGIVDEETFLKWREDINDQYPGKGQALFQLNQWLTWLEQEDEEEEE